MIVSLHKTFDANSRLEMFFSSCFHSPGVIGISTKIQSDIFNILFVLSLKSNKTRNRDLFIIHQSVYFLPMTKLSHRKAGLIEYQRDVCFFFN